MSRGAGRRQPARAPFGTRRPGSDPEKFGGIAKVRVTGEMQRI